MENCGDFCGLSRIMADGKERKIKWTFLYQNYSTAQKVRRTSTRVASQYTSEADLSELL